VPGAAYLGQLGAGSGAAGARRRLSAMPMPAVDRVIPTTGIHNFRDYGGYPVASGGRLASGRLYRSGEHAEATDRDLLIVQDLDPAAVIDLRGATERRDAPCRRPPGFSAIVIAVDGETASLAPHIAAFSGVASADDAHRNMRERYAELPFRPQLIEAYRRYLHALSNATGSTLVYCKAGKDRTGIAVALLHMALGVHPDDVLEDYLLTNTVGNSTERIAALTRYFHGRAGPKMSDAALRIVLTVDEQFLHAALQAIKQQCGSVDEYLESTLGITRAMRAALAARLVA
jgi:protein tyrosine/serine phosphatase